jgi:hypothetical protein
MAATHIYSEDPLSSVTASHNRLGLFLSKYIRHGLVVKINGKRRLRICEALVWISADYLRARRAPMPIATPRPTRRAERAHACFSIYSLLHTLVSV